MGKGFNNYMTKKFFHPSSKENIKRVWMAQQKTEFEKKKQEDLLNQYQKEQEMYQNRALLGDEKAKLGLSFMYDAPPGLKKKEEEKDEETEVKFEWQRKYNAPREQYAKNDDEIRDQPFGIEVRNVRCIKCRKWGHVNTDKICPLFNTDLTAEPPQPSTSAASLLQGMKEDGFKLKQSILGRMAEDPSAEHEKMLDSGDEDDPEVKFLKSLSAKQKKKLLKKLNSLQDGKGKKLKKQKKKKKHRSSSVSSSVSDSEEHSSKKRKKKKQATSKSDDSDTDRKKKKKKKRQDDSDSDDSEREAEGKRKKNSSDDSNRKSGSKGKGKRSENMARYRSPDNRQHHSRDNHARRRRSDTSSSDSSSDFFENGHKNERKSYRELDKNRSRSPHKRRSQSSRSTSRERYRNSKSDRSRSRDRGQRFNKNSRSRSRSRNRADKAKNRSEFGDNRRRSRSREKQRSRSNYSRSLSRSRSRDRSGYMKSSVNTPPLKGWLPSAEVTPGVKDRVEKSKTSVWIVGSSIVYWAHKRASQTKMVNLKIKTSDACVEWYGTRGMRWNALLSKLVELVRTKPPPDVLILYVGSNDVGYIKPTDLVKMIKTDMSTIKEMCPDTVLVYNEILSRINWRGAPNNEDGEQQRLTINKYIKPIMESMGGHMIHHPDIRNVNTALYRDDGVHLNDTGYDIFIGNVENAVRTILLTLKI